MLKKIFGTLALILALTYLGTAQTNNTFDGTGNVNGSGLWVLPTGGGASNWTTGAPQLDGSGNWSPYHSTVVNGYSYSIYDSNITVGAGKEVWHIVGALSGVNNTRVVGVGPTTLKTLTSACMYYGSIQQMTAATDQYVLKRMDFNMPTLGGVNPDGGATRYIAHEWVVGDTLGYTVWPSNYVTLWVASSGGGRDTLAGNTTLYDYATLGFYPFIGGQDQTTDTKITKWGIRDAASGGAPPPPATEANPPVTSDGNPSSLSLYFGQLARIDYSWTEDSTAKWYKTQWDTLGGTWMALDSIAISGTAGSVQSSYKTRYTAGNINFRGIVSDAVDKKDTSATKSVAYSAAPAAGTFDRIVAGWATFDDVRWKNMPNPTGDIPSDSLPWAALTHLSLFAAGGGTPIPNSYANQLPYFTAEAHSYGVFAGLTYGGSGDAALIAMTTNPSAWPAWINYNMNLIRNGLDYLDFDYEGTITGGQVYAFFDVLYDSLQTATSANDPTRAPFIVLTVGNSRAASWVSLEPFVDVVYLMTYDKAGDWWGRIIPDAMPRTTKRWDGDISGGFAGAVNTTFYPLIGQANSEAPSFQAGARAVAAAGWPKEKLCVGFDANPTYWYGSVFPDGRGPRYLWEPTSGTTQTIGSNLDFSTTWPSISGVSFSDSIVFDTASYSYWAHQGTSQATDRVWVFQTYPGKDSGMLGSRKVVDSMNLGGIVFWNLGSEVWNTASIPPGGRGWLFRQIELHFGSGAAVPQACAPPVTPVPSNGATGQILATVFNWEDRACVAASAGYQFQADDTTDFLTPIKDTTVTPSGITLASGYLTNGQTVRWRVRVKDATTGQWGEWSTIWSYTTVVAVPGAPTIIFPITGLTLSGISVPVTWSASTNGPASYIVGTSFYEVHSSTSPTFTTTFKRDSTTNNGNLTRLYNLFGMLNSTTYYIRVRAKTAGGYSAWSVTVSVTAGAAVPLAPLLSSPANNAGDQDTALTMSWTHAANYWFYDWRYDTLSTLATALDTVSTSSNSISVVGLTPSKRYYWQVRTIGSADTSGWSDPFSFTTSQAAPPILPSPNIQMGGWYSIVEGRWVWTRSAPWLIYAFSRSDMSDVPPPEAGMIAWSPYGIKLKTDWGTDTTLLYSFGLSGSGGVSLTEIKNAMADSSVFSGVQIQQPIITGIGFLMKHTDSLSSWYSLFRAPSVDENLIFDLPTRSGKFALADGDILTPQSVETKTPIGPKSGALGFTPGDAYNAGTGAFFWGFDPSDTANWTLYPLASLRSQYGILTNSGITGPKIPYLDANETWQFLDTNYYRDAGAGSYPGGARIVDSLNTGQQNDTLTNSLTMSDSLWFKYNAGSTYGYAFAGNGYVSQITLGTSTYYENRNNQNNSGFSSRDKIPMAFNQGSATGGVVSREYTSMTGTDPERVVMQGKATTTDDATVVVIKSILLDDSSSTGTGVTFPDSATYTVTAHINGTWITGAGGTNVDGAAYILTGTYRQAGTPGATITLIGSVTTVHSAETAAFSACTPAFVINGKWLEISVDGDASSEISWTATIDITWSGGY